jgi:hypothetical protein
MPEEQKKKVTVGSIDIKWVVSLMIPVIAWCISIEVRLSSGLPGRVANLETALTPVLIEYGVRQELAKRGDSRGSITTDNQDKVEAVKPEHKDLVDMEKKKIYSQFPNAAPRK